MTDNEKIATLTSGAIRASGQKVAEEIITAVEAAEEAVRQLRSDGELLIAEIRSHTETFAEAITSFVGECHSTTEMFRKRREEPLNKPPLRELPVLISEKDLKVG